MFFFCIEEKHLFKLERDIFLLVRRKMSSVIKIVLRNVAGVVTTWWWRVHMAEVRTPTTLLSTILSQKMLFFLSEEKHQCLVSDDEKHLHRRKTSCRESLSQYDNSHFPLENHHKVYGREDEHVGILLLCLPTPTSHQLPTSYKSC
jgi:hypothetical protein